MGGFFQAQPPQTVSGLPPELSPFLRQMTQAVAGLFGAPSGISPLEEGTVRGVFQSADPARQLLQQQVSGQYLPGTPGGNENPFIQQLMAGMTRQDDLSQRQLASAAQRSGALNSTDYLRQSADLAAQGGERRAGLLSDIYSQERQYQNQAVPGQIGLGQALLGFAGYPRQQYMAGPNVPRFPFEAGASLLGGGGAQGQTIPGQPSPFASLLGGLAPWASLFIH